MLSNIHKSRSTRMFGLAIAFAALLTPPLQASASSASTTVAPTTVCPANTAPEVLFAVYFGEGPAATRLPAAFVAERRKNLERVRGQTSAMRSKVLSRLRVELEKAGKPEDAAMVAKLVEIYEHAASLGQDPRSGGTMSAASREAFAKAFEKKSPGALATFAAAMASKDPTKVRAALRRTATQVLDVARLLGEAAPAGGSAEQQIVVDTAVHLAWILPVPPLVAETATGLGEDQLVALLTTAFGC